MTADPQPSATARILHVDDDERLARSVARLLRMNGFSEIEVCNDPTSALERIAAFRPDLLIVDLVMPEIGGRELIEAVRRQYPAIGVIVLTADYDARAAVECMRLGAKEFLLKPVRTEELLAAVSRVLDEVALAFEAASLREQFFSPELRRPEAFADIVTRDPTMARVFAYLEAVAKGSQPLLVTGETGTGKELIASSLHKASGRSGDFVAINVAGLDDSLFSDALFGHVKGAFTGADRDRRGMLDAGRGGTVLLDEVGDLSEASQIKLLRVLQEREYTPVGSDEARPLEARVIAATHREPGSLREDLYFRLRSYHVSIPPLRERIGDLPLLVDVFLEVAAQDLGRVKPTVPPELFYDLGRYAFPGNVRELRAMVFDAVARHGQGVMPIHLFTDQIDRDAAFVDASDRPVFPHPMPTLRQIESEAMTEALRRTDGNRSAAARMLDVSRPKILRHVAQKRDGEG